MMNKKQNTAFTKFKKVVCILTFAANPCTGFSLLPNFQTKTLHTFSLSCVDSPIEDSKELLWSRLVENFQGDFDNFNQVVEDRAQNLLPREGGGHEKYVPLFVCFFLLQRVCCHSNERYDIAFIAPSYQFQKAHGLQHSTLMQIHKESFVSVSMNYFQIYLQRREIFK